MRGWTKPKRLCVLGVLLSLPKGCTKQTTTTFHGTISTFIRADPATVLICPSHWTLQEEKSQRHSPEMKGFTFPNCGTETFFWASRILNLWKKYWLLSWDTRGIFPVWDTAWVGQACKLSLRCSSELTDSCLHALLMHSSPSAPCYMRCSKRTCHSNLAPCVLDPKVLTPSQPCPQGPSTWNSHTH